MRALTVIPGSPHTALVQEVPEPQKTDGSLLVETIAVGICGTDREILAGHYGASPPGATHLIIGHESLGRVVESTEGSSFGSGDLVVGIVRRPDPRPCPYCAAGEWDMCRNGLYTECGIKERHGFCADRFRLDPAFAIKIDPALGDVGVLLEPTSIVAKAWDHAERIGRRSSAWRPRTVLVTGAGPIGLLAALMGRQRGLDVHVFDRIVEGRKPELVRALGATFHGGSLTALEELAPDVIIECTGATAVIADVVTRSAPSGIVCLAGVSSGGHAIRLDLGDVNRRMVLQNDAIFGSVNANRSHYEAAADAIGRADRSWLAGLITRRVTLDRWAEAVTRQPDDVKVVIDFERAA
ncbi:MAG TPA: glucose 1-dehydrogenase [Vicinamibacterales bacterium]|nr:glucose 1-dehydrogenase [Vicinamibacterales bacterium]